MKAAYFFIFSLLLVLSCNDTHTQNIPTEVQVVKESVSNSVIEAQQIIARAQELCVYIPDSGSRFLITQALAEIIIVEADSAGKATYASSNRFALMITDPSLLKKTKDVNTQINLFQFDPVNMEQTRHIVILMNKNISTLSNNLDGKACILIHEFTHALQANNRIGQGIPNATAPGYPDEQQAWECQGYIYAKVHPEILQYSCDCQTLKINGLTEKMDPITWNIIMYNFCKDKFLRTMYK